MTEHRQGRAKDGRWKTNKGKNSQKSMFGSRQTTGREGSGAPCFFSACLSASQAATAGRILLGRIVMVGRAFGRVYGLNLGAEHAAIPASADTWMRHCSSHEPTQNQPTLFLHPTELLVSKLNSPQANPRSCSAWIFLVLLRDGATGRKDCSVRRIEAVGRRQMPAHAGRHSDAAAVNGVSS
jgi:hypothetical protein